MREETRKLILKAKRALRAAESLHDQGDADFAAGRAYYAMFYLAQALLNERDLHFRKHSGVHAAFGEHFAKSGILDPKLHRWLLDAFDKRILGDYEVDEDTINQGWQAEDAKPGTLGRTKVYDYDYE